MTQKIILTVSDSFIVPDFIETLTIEETETILNTIITLNLNKNVNVTTNNFYTKDITELKHTNKKLIEQLNSQYSKFHDEITSEKERFNLLLDTYKSIIDELNNIKSTDSVKQLQMQLQPIIKMYLGTNEEKGTYGENHVSSIIQSDNRYITAKIIDTSAQAEAGDFHMIWNGIKCLFEVKNKKILTLDDMKKFERDVRENGKKGTINCAIFASLRTDNFPQRSREYIQVDMIDNIPVIYTYILDPIHIHYSIECLKNIVILSNNDDIKTKKLTNYFKKYIKNISHYLKYFNTSLKQKQLEIKNIQKEIQSLTILDEEINNDILLLTNNDVLLEQTSETPLEQTLENSLENQLEQTSENPSEQTSETLPKTIKYKKSYTKKRT